MSMPSFFIAMFIFFLILSPPVTTTKGPKITAMVVAASRLLAGWKPNDQMTMFKPEAENLCSIVKLWITVCLKAKGIPLRQAIT